MRWINEPNVIEPNIRSCGANICWSRDENNDCQADYCSLRVCLTRFCLVNF
ncbi:hypothetical protein GNF85_25470 [Clostridium perfringens]